MKKEKSPLIISDLENKIKMQITSSSLIILLLFFCSSCSSQTTAPLTDNNNDTSAYNLVIDIEIEAKLIATDKLQQLYIVTEKNEVIKYNSEGKELFRFSNNTLGELTHIDATNPFSVLLYYPDYMTVHTLGRTFNQTGEFNLFDLNLTDVQAVGMANDNNVWLYDDVFYKIKKINRRGDILRQSENLQNQLDKLIEPNFIVERENLLYVNDPKLGVLVFDIYGQYVKTLEIKNLTSFQIMGEQLIYQEENQLKSFHLKSLVSKIINLPSGISNKHQVQIQKSNLFVMKKESVSIYKY